MEKEISKEKTYSLRDAYIMFFVIQAPYGYVNQWGYQIMYWIGAWSFFYVLQQIFGDQVNNQSNIPGMILATIIALSFLFWAVHVFLALPNLVKMEKLKMYKLKNSEDLKTR